MTILFPVDTLKPAKITRHITARTTAGTVAFSGFTQAVSPPAHAWIIQYDGIMIATDTQWLVWDYFAAQIDGRANSCLVPLIGEYSGGTDDGAVAANASSGATSIVITRAIPIALGYHFSIGERLYRSISVTGPSGDDYTVGIRPPLREPITAAAVVSFASPVCKCRLATDDEMMIERDPARIGTGKIKFVEDPR